MAETDRRPRPVAMLAAGLLGWVGEVAHNAVELPQLTLASPENWAPLLVTLALLAAWRWGPRRPAAWGLLGWATLHLLVGAVLTVLPLPVLPFEPAQTLRHYGAHVLYGVAQAPLLWLAWGEVRDPQMPWT